MKPESQTEIDVKIDAEIDAALRALGGVQPPAGFAGRVNAHLRPPRRKLRTIHLVSAGALAASIAISILALSPALREPILDVAPSPSLRLAGQPAAGLVAHPAGNFGAASAVHVPIVPMPVVPIPVGQAQGRGHTRSSRPVRPADAGQPADMGGSRRTLPHRVAVSAVNPPANSGSGPLARTAIDSAAGHP